MNNKGFNNKKNYDKDSNSQSYDIYKKQYEEQLNRFSEMDGNDFSDELDASDLEFHSADEINGYQYDIYNASVDNNSNSMGRRSSSSSQRSGQLRQRPNNGGNNAGKANRVQNRDLQFGTNNSSKSNKGKYNSDVYDNSNRRQVKTNNKSQKKRNNKKVKDNRRKSPVKRFFKWLIIILLMLAIIAELLIYRYVSMINIVDTGERLYTKASMYDDDIMNVLVIGSDSRSVDERGRTDSMIILSINKNNKEIVMTSLMRDMYVEIPNNGWSKLNSANVYGGPELLMDTIELNFDIRIDKYIYIDFYSFVDIVDAVGGIELDISDEEAAGMTAPMAEQNKIMGNPKGTDYLTEGGKLKVNGNQALAYARLRYVGNADFERTERQRTVISKIMEKAVTFNPIKLDKFAKASLSHITTNMTKTELQIFANKAPFILRYETKQLRIPEEGMYSYGSHDGQSTLDVDFGACKQALKEKIYS